MGLAGARNSAVTGLQAQSTNIAITSDNIANASTVGYKAIKGAFETLVTGSNSSLYSSGGVSITPQTLVQQQGLIEATSSGTDLAISGSGFFAVQDDGGTLLLTRAGSFTVNNKGELTNTSGFKLLGWPLNNDGLLPGQVGNTNTNAAESTSSLVVVDTNAASGTASATTTVKLGMNLNSSQSTFQGATVTLAPVSSANTTSLLQGDIIVPGSGMQEGDSFTLASTYSGTSSSTTFTYGGFAQSKNITQSAIYGVSSAANSFSTSAGDLTSGDSFSITTTSSGTSTFVYTPSSPNTSNGQFNSLNTLATAINAVVGLTARVSNGVLYVSSDVATEAVTFADVTSGCNMVAELGFSNEAAAAGGINRFNTMYGLSVLANTQTQIGAKVNNPTSVATIDLFAKDPLQTLTITKVKNALTIDLQSDENGTNTPTALIAPVETDQVSTMVPEIGDGTPIGASVSTISFTDGTNTGTFSYGGIGASKAIGTASTIFGASTASGGSLADTTDLFVSGTGGLDTNDTITFSDGTVTTTVTFKGATATASLATGEFNSLITLATAISSGGNFAAKVVNGKLYIASAASANNAVSVSATAGITGAQIVTALGGDWNTPVLNTAQLVTAQDTGGGGNNRFATLSQLNTLIEGITNFSTVDPTGSNANIGISLGNEAQITVGGSGNAMLLKELGITSGTVGNGFFTEMGIDSIVAANTSTDAAAVASTTIPVTYDPGNILKNMATSKITPHFSRNIRIYDKLGTGHDFKLAFLKIGVNKWAVEVYALTQTDITNDTNSDGLLASGEVTFNGDGSLASVSSALTSALTVSWTTGSSSSEVTFNFGTAGQPNGTTGATVIGLTDGVRQFDTAYNVDFVQQNGVAAGQFNGIEVAEDGTVSAKFSNGQIKAIYRLPIVTLANPNALTQKSGNVFAVTQASGEVNLKQAGLGGAGVIVPSALEGSTADIASELTKTIGIQANYNANAALISTVKSMEEELNRRI